MPPAVVPSGANTHDMKLLNDTLDGLVVLRPAPTPEKPQNVCLDAGYTGAGEILAQRGFTAHIRPRGEEKHFLKGVCRTFHAAHIRPRGEEKGNCVTMDPTLKFGAHPPARGGEEVDCAFPGIQGVTLGCGGLPFPAQPFPQDTRAFREKSALIWLSCNSHAL